MTRRDIPLLLLITCGGFGVVRSTVCGVCPVLPLPLFQNKRVYVGVLWTKETTSRAECAARCSYFGVIRYFGFKDSSGECVAYTVPLTTPAATKYVDESGFNMYSLCAPVSPFGSCVSSSDCPGAKTTCNDGRCVCDMMHVYSHGNCVQGCSTYGSEFTTFRNNDLLEHNDKVVENVPTIEMCSDLCSAETNFLCITADYQFSKHVCFLSSTAWYDAPSYLTEDSPAFHGIIRNCA
ncbi:uncharacterized protein [Haliotis cracherodii]|uniref:uncharacterized protein n=1 Tax=Haliotis cracherodii TaxID=6455 RepID=UPI0039EBB5AC